jgi:hypothetical protein
MLCSREEIRRELAAQYENHGHQRPRPIGTRTWSPAVALGFLGMLITAVAAFIALAITLTIR